IGFPVVVKTLARGIHHKSDQAGGFLNLSSRALVSDAYRNIAERLGPVCLVQAQAEAGVEIYVGIGTDSQFGPLMTLGMGGVLVETLSDTVTFLPPIDEVQARQYLQRLRGFPLLEGIRGRPAVNMDDLC